MNKLWYDAKQEILDSLRWQEDNLTYWVNNPVPVTDVKKVCKALKELQNAIAIIENATITPSKSE